jgi:hypothetical protein
MLVESLCVLQSFIAFFIQFDAAIAHNMMTLMLGPIYKGFKCVVDLIGKEGTWV